MSLVNDFVKGFEFNVCGKVGDTMSFPTNDGDTMRMVRIIAMGRTYNLEVENDEMLAQYDRVKGRWCRAFGVLGRRRGSAAGTAKIVRMQIEGMKDWKELSDDEILGNCKFDGVCMVVQKKSGVFSGISFRKLQVNTFGETFEFKDIEPELFETLPESGALKIEGHLEPVLASSSSGKIADLVLVIDKHSLPGSSGKTDRRPGQPDPGANPEQKTG